jgi:hypothetical protein
VATIPSYPPTYLPSQHRQVEACESGKRLLDQIDPSNAGSFVDASMAEGRAGRLLQTAEAPLERAYAARLQQLGARDPDTKRAARWVGR